MIERWNDASLDAMFRKELAAATSDWHGEGRAWAAPPAVHKHGTRILTLLGVAVATATFVVVALIVHNGAGNSSSPGSGVSLDARQQRAVAAARVVAQGGSTIPVSFVSVTSGRFGDFEPGAGAIVSSPGREVWVVVFRGKEFALGGCGAVTITGSPRACPAANATEAVILDYSTDAFVMEDVKGNAGTPGAGSGQTSSTATPR